MIALETEEDGAVCIIKTEKEIEHVPSDLLFVFGLENKIYQCLYALKSINITTNRIKQTNSCEMFGKD